MKRTAIVAALVGLVLGAAPATATATTSEYGHTRSKDRVLKYGCNNYRYTFVVKAPTDDWTLETFLKDPDGETLASGTFSSDSEPNKGHGRFRICRNSTRPGKFTIKAKLVWYRGYEEHQARFDPSHFRLRRAS
jgi:hypothetical protein